MREVVIVLVRPQLPENVGAVARVMLNFDLRSLRLVAPRCGVWPSEKLEAMAAGASEVLARLEVCETLQDALSDVNYVCATTARLRYVAKRTYTPQEAVSTMMDLRDDLRCGFVFGPERSGLTNEDISLVDSLCSIEVNPSFSSLNLAQAVNIMAYLWFSHHARQGDASLEQASLSLGILGKSIAERAPKKDIFLLFEHLERALDASGFFRVEEKREIMVQNLRALLMRCEPSSQEVQTLRGVIRALHEATPPA